VRVSRYEMAVDHYNRSLALFRQTGDAVQAKCPMCWTYSMCWSYSTLLAAVVAQTCR
jgi:hypothetical protein